MTKAILLCLAGASLLAAGFTAFLFIAAMVLHFVHIGVAAGLEVDRCLDRGDTWDEASEMCAYGTAESP